MALAHLAPVHGLLHGLALPHLLFDDLNDHLGLEPVLLQLLLALAGHHSPSIADDRDVLHELLPVLLELPQLGLHEVDALSKAQPAVRLKLEDLSQVRTGVRQI